MEIFEKFDNGVENKPISSIFYPADWDSFVGQEHLVAPGRPLRVLIEKGKLVPMVFYGPPGTGKTALARIIAKKVKVPFFYINASTAKPKELREVLTEAEKLWITRKIRPILYIDEVHRFNRHHQEILLYATEKGTLVFIGSTVLNPYFYISKSLISRSIVFEFRPLKEKDLLKLLLRAKKTFFGDREIDLDVLKKIARTSAGDARRALNLLELICITTEHKKITLEDISNLEEASGQVLVYDRDQDEHYDLISAFIKSLRGSDPNASVYWLVRMLEAGEDPRFLLRRMLIFASEDIGLADPQAIVIASSVAEAFERVGRPEGDLLLTELALYLAVAPKSNTVYRTLGATKKILKEGHLYQVPDHLRDSHYSGAQKLGHGKGYIYPHEKSDKNQNYLPDNLDGLSLFEPRPIGYEKKIIERMKEVKR